MSYTYFNISDKLRLYEFEGLLDQYGDATAAYSLRKLRNDYTGSAIRVRRSSDDAERDMGFYDNELDTVALLDWVNQEINIADYNVISNVGNTIATKIAPFTYNATSDGNGGSTIRPKISFTTTTAGNSYQLIITPSNQSGTINFKLYDGSSYIITGNDLSAGIDTTFTANGGVFIAFDGTQIFNVDFTIELNALSADGHVQTWYDQSANANHAVQNTDTAQPKIVDAGTLVTEGGKPAITMDGVDDEFSLTTGVTSTDFSVLTVLNLDDTFATTLYGGIINAPTNGFIYHFGQGYNFRNAGTYHRLVHPISETGQHLVFMDVNGTIGNGYLNGQSSLTNVSVTNTGLTFGGLFNDAFSNQLKANVQELVLYDSYRDDEANDFMFNANAYYNIY